MEDFLDHTYGTVSPFSASSPLPSPLGHQTAHAPLFVCQLFDTEAKRRIRKEPATALELSQVPEADGLDELWTIA
ncbi:hypothetical protein OH76DRAFT_1408043 [Lentinus brumalis]|uniref:Uncharacterized protein n=1 Tax=Lentinus brumalis TaxID=2498619 RepID=A0A371CYX2_9APHY|nr:hypothetical protein OH76DRAFT_1408043 [Polyporus brumalis]